MPISIPPSTPDLPAAATAAPASTASDLASVSEGLSPTIVANDGSTPIKGKHSSKQAPAAFADLLVSARSAKATGQKKSSATVDTTPLTTATPTASISDTTSIPAPTVLPQVPGQTPTLAVPPFGPSVAVPAATTEAEATDTEGSSTVSSDVFGQASRSNGLFGAYTSRTLAAASGTQAASIQANPAGSTVSAAVQPATTTPSTTEAETVTELSSDEPMVPALPTPFAVPMPQGRGGHKTVVAQLPAASSSRAGMGAVPATASADSEPTTAAALTVSVPAGAAVPTQPNASAGANLPMENFADALTGQTGGRENFEDRSDKQSQNKGEQVLAKVSGVVGTSSAKSTPAMPTDLHARVSTTASSPQEVSPAASATVGSTVSQTSAPAPTSVGQVADPAALPTTAHGAVASILKVVDLQTSSSDAANSSVNLHFKIGEANLTVRVEMQAGTVHTQFSTSSTELRNAIATEWQSVSGSLTAKAVHFAEPTFSSSGGSSQQDSGTRWSDGQAQQQRHASPDDYAAATGYRPSSSQDDETEVATASASSGSSLLSNRLQMFA